MKPFKTLISLDEALSLVMAEARPVSRTETVPLTNALGRVLAEGTPERIRRNERVVEAYLGGTDADGPSA